jgi:hypothetical protein
MVALGSRVSVTILSLTTITIGLGLTPPGRRTGVDDVEILIVGSIEIEPHIAKYRVDRAEPLRDAAGRYCAGVTAQNQP